MKKKNRKLIFQVSIVILPLFILMIAAVTWAMYSSTVNSFLDAQGEHMKYLLANDIYNVEWLEEKELGWYFDQWEKRTDKIREGWTEELSDEMADKYPSYFDFEDRQIDEDDPDLLPDELQAYMAMVMYNTISAWNGAAFDKNSYDYLFCIDLSEEYRGMVLYEYRKEGNARKIGDYYNFDLKQHSEVENMIKNCSSEIVFERTKNFPSDGSFFIAYQPMVVDGKVRAATAIAYNWDQLKLAVMLSLKKALFISVGVMIITLMLLQIILYRKTIAPVSKIQKSVRDYIENKASTAVISKMDEIKERNEFGLLSDNISELAKEIDRFNEENVRLATEKERVAAELDMATRIQSEQLPNRFPAFPDRSEFDIYATMTPAKEVGGDFYDFFFVDDDHLALVIADVSGKGVPAALFMMMSKILINNYAMMGLSPREVLEHTNETICKNNKQKMFVTVWFGILEISTGRITAANAGHEYPIVRQPGGSFELFKDKHGFVLGLKKGKKYTEYGFTLQKGGTLFVYTDGVPEATNAETAMFGTDRLVEMLAETGSEKPRELLESVHAAVNGFVGDAPQFDDLTMLGITLNERGI